MDTDSAMPWRICVRHRSVLAVMSETTKLREKGRQSCPRKLASGAQAPRTANSFNRVSSLLKLVFNYSDPLEN